METALPAILVCNYTDSEISAWKFLLRGFPLLRFMPIAPEQFGCRIQDLLKGTGVSAEPPAFTTRMVLFSGMQGELLLHLIDLSKQASREMSLRATLTETNQGWTLNRLYKNLEEEHRRLSAKR